jgi:hypothetical protein
MEPQRPVQRVTANLEILRFPTPFESSVGANCLNCSWPLELSQPDLSLPERLLGICERCKHWFLVDLIPDQNEGIIARLPETQVIRSLSHENPREGISEMSHGPERKSVPPTGQGQGQIEGPDARP